MTETFTLVSYFVDGVKSNKYTKEVLILVDTAEVERKHESNQKKSFINKCEAVLVQEHLQKLIG